MSFNVLVIFCLISLISGQRIINSSYKRSVFFTGSLVREEHLINVEVADESSKPAEGMPEDLVNELHQNWFPNYVFVVPKSQAEGLANWDASLIPSPGEPGTSPLAITEITSEVPTCQKYGIRCLNVVLPMDGQLNKKFLIAISVTFMDQLTLKPKVQKEMSLPVRLFYRSESLEPVSIYETGASQTILGISKKSKSLKLRCPVGRKPEKLTGATVLPMEMKGFFCAGQANGPVEFHFESKDATMLRITNLHRKLTHLPWSNEIQVTESYEYVHFGPVQPESPSFSRIDFAKTLQKTHGNLEGLQIVPKVLLLVPSGARTLQIRDEVGIIWNEQSRDSVDDETDIISVNLRFPLIGGMSAYFDFHYTIDASDLIKPFKSQSSPFKKLIQMPMLRIPLDIPVDNFILTFVFPEDASDIEYEFGTGKPVHKVKRRTFRTYFSTSGEKEISFEFQKMTREELEKGIAILYNYPFWGALRKPFIALSSLVFLIIGALYVNRIDLSLRSNKAKKAKNAKLSSNLKILFDKRREILMNYEDLICGNANSRKNDLDLKNQLDEQLNLLQMNIFEKIKLDTPTFPDPQKSTMNSLALKRLYDEQNGICKKILSEMCEKFNESQSQSMDSVSSIGNLNEMSQSGSADLLSTVRSNKAIDTLSKEAIKLDSQVMEYEFKFLN